MRCKVTSVVVSSWMGDRQERPITVALRSIVILRWWSFEWCEPDINCSNILSNVSSFRFRCTFLIVQRLGRFQLSTSRIRLALDWTETLHTFSQVFLSMHQSLIPSTSTLLRAATHSFFIVAICMLRLTASLTYSFHCPADCWVLAVLFCLFYL